MKSERRHELQHNALAEWMTDSYEAIRPYGNTILAVLTLVLLVFAGWLWWSRQSALDRATAWGDLFNAATIGDMAQLSEISTKYRGSSAGAWAAVLAGNASLNNGTQQLTRNKAEATQELTKAVSSFQDALQQSQQVEVRQQATYGLAQAYEALCATPQADMSKAIETYESLVKQWPDNAFAKAAQRRLDDLKQAPTKQFYDQLAKYEPKPPAEGADDSGKRLHFDPNALPDPGAISLPTLGGSSESPSSEAAPATTEKAAEKPAETPAGSTPAPPPENQ